jgi:hypothetical protein
VSYTNVDQDAAPEGVLVEYVCQCSPTVMYHEFENFWRGPRSPSVESNLDVEGQATRSGAQVSWLHGEAECYSVAEVLVVGLTSFGWCGI